jgi:hypothetical protein
VGLGQAPIKSSGGNIPWSIVSGNINVSASGGRLSVDASAADVVLQLPASPAANTEVSYQISDTSANNVYIQPQTPDTIGTQAANYRGKHNPSIERSLTETLRYVSGRWLPYFGRLVYESFVVSGGDPYDANVVFFATFQGANNSTTFTDTKGNSISTRLGTPKISTAQSIGGGGSLVLDGLSSLLVPANPLFGSGTGDFDLEMALYPTAFTTGENQGLFDRRGTISATPDLATLNNVAGVGYLNLSTGSPRIALAPLKLNQWQVVRFSRYQGVTTFYIDNIPVYSAVDSANYTSTAGWVLFDILDTASPNAGMFQGFCQYIRDTRISRSQGYGKPRLVIDNTDPLEAFKIVDLTFDGGTIVDLKGNSIALGGTPTVSTVQKRSGSHSLALDGSQHLDLTVPASNFGNSPYTISTSFRFAAVGSVTNYNSPNLQYIFDCLGGNTSALNWYGATNQLAIVNAGAGQAIHAQAPAANIWYDVVFLKIDTQYLLALNNKIVAAASTAPATVNLSSSPIRVGREKVSATAGLNGFIDNFRIYACANGANLTHSNPLKFLARFTNNSPNDELGAVGTFVGTAHTYDTTNKRTLEASALFAGDGYISYPAISAYDFGSGEFEVAGWIKPSIAPNNISCSISNGIVSGTFDTQSWGVYDNFSGQTSRSGKTTLNKLSFWAGGVDLTQAVVSSTTSVNDGQPHYFRIIKYTFASQAATVLVLDGKIEDVFIGTYAIAPTTRPLILGSALNTAGREYKGNLDDVAIYKA